MKATTTISLMLTLLLTAMTANANKHRGNSSHSDTLRPARVTTLYQEDFAHGTFIIDKPGIYRLGENISFNPNSKSLLNDLCDQEPASLPHGFQCPADAYQAGFPFHTQYQFGPGAPFTPGGPLDARYDPAAYGLGFFAAIAISADKVLLDLNGYAIEQSEEHALLQRFFSVIELADRPFIPAQGPSDFGSAFDPAIGVIIRNGLIGRSAHHGIHGNDNQRVRISNVDFFDYEVAAVALNGVSQAVIKHVTASNRQDVPVLGTFSSAQFIKPYIEYLLRTGSELELNGVGVAAIRDQLRESINRVHKDLIEVRNVVDGRPQIDAQMHPAEFALYSNPHGVVDGNAYSFVINPLGVAVNGFPQQPENPARHITFFDVHVLQQRAAINEVVALSVDGAPVTDPVGAVFQTLNKDQAGNWITISATGAYVGNVVANAQALVAKAVAAGEFDSAPLDVSRNSISAEVLEWIEGGSDAALPNEPDSYLCNGDSMFHVNKGVIAFKIDGAKNVLMYHTSVRDLSNLGHAGSAICGDYSNGWSHPAATLPGYGGAHARGYTFAGSQSVQVVKARLETISAASGSSKGFDILTDSRDIGVRYVRIKDVGGGMDDSNTYPLPNRMPDAFGIRIDVETQGIKIRSACVRGLSAPANIQDIMDLSGIAQIKGRCRR